MKKSDAFLLIGGGLFAASTLYGVNEYVEASALHEIAQTLPHGNEYNPADPNTNDLFTQETFEGYSRDHLMSSKFAGAAALGGLGVIAAALRHSQRQEDFTTHKS